MVLRLNLQLIFPRGDRDVELVIRVERTELLPRAWSLQPRVSQPRELTPSTSKDPSSAELHLFAGWAADDCDPLPALTIARLVTLINGGQAAHHEPVLLHQHGPC